LGLAVGAVLGLLGLVIAEVSSQKAVPKRKLRFQCPHCHKKYDVGLDALSHAEFVRCPLDHSELPLEDVLNRYKVAV
jgi:hypothetical protein